MIVYKVCFRKRNNKFMSACLGNLPNRCKVRYEVGKVTKPKIKGSKLFVFSTYEAAKKWMNCIFSEYTHVIFKCETQRAFKPKYKTMPDCCYADQFWATKLMHKVPAEYLSHSNMPEETMWCDSVKPIAAFFH